MNEQIKQHLMKVLEAKMEILMEVYQDHSLEDQCKAVLNDMGIRIPFEVVFRGVINGGTVAILDQALKELIKAIKKAEEPVPSAVEFRKARATKNRCP